MLCRVWVAFSAMHSARVVGEEEVHLRGRLGARRELELHPDAVDDALLAGGRDAVGRDDEGHRAGRGGLAQAGADLAVGPRSSTAPYM